MLIAAILLLSSMAAPAMTAPIEQCSAAMKAAGLCTVTNSGTSVDVTGTRPGQGGGGDTRGGGGSRGDGSEESDDPGAEDDGTLPAQECDDPPLCRGNYEVAIIRQPTLADIASFAPASVTLVDEPDGVGVVGMPMNFVLNAQAHTATGELFDLPVSVRFVPTSFAVVHGDGTTGESASGGDTWSELGRAQFSATTTSYAYGERGTYTAHGIVRYSAAVDFGSGWFPVPGTLEIPTAGTTIDVVEVRTALVDETCLEDADGPGC